MKSQTPNRSEPVPGTSFEVALRVLGAREHSCHEMGQKLLSRGLEEVEVQETLRKLKQYGYLDDERFAAILARSNQGLGRRGLAHKMTQKGVAAEVSNSILSQIDDEEELTRALAAARKHSPAHKIASLERDTWQRRLASFLSRRGFSMPVILTVCRQLDEERALELEEING